MNCFARPRLLALFAVFWLRQREFGPSTKLFRLDRTRIVPRWAVLIARGPVVSVSATGSARKDLAPAKDPMALENGVRRWCHARVADRLH